MFRVDEVVIYNDSPTKTSQVEGRLFEKLLRYQETPQYLRRALFPPDSDLQFVGVLPPLRLPSHPNPEKPLVGIVREGLVIDSGETSLVNAGFTVPVKVRSKLRKPERVTVRVTVIQPELEGEVVDPNRLPIYWGFKVNRPGFTLGQLVGSKQMGLTISTSREGREIREEIRGLNASLRSAPKAIMLFGSPDQGVEEILRMEGMDVGKVCDYNLNTIPHQGVETVRTEEALIASLSALNAFEEI